VSILETPIERLTRTGLRTTEREFEFDIIVFATGFDAITGSFDRIDIRGCGGAKLKDRWKGGPSTFLGVMINGFPNLFMVMGPHTALGNIPRSIEYNVEWIRDLLAFLDQRGLRYADARPEAVDDWTAFVKRKGQGLLANEVDSWMTGVNQNVEGKQVRIIARYSGTAPEYRDWCDRVAAEEYRELLLR
jgi:cation diffusion facilitator CzcD-associated flavoprotein CzcO